MNDWYEIPHPEIKMFSANGVTYPHPALTEWEKENTNQLVLRGYYVREIKHCR